VLAVGEDAAIAALEQWLWQGPPLAKVSGVQREEVGDASEGQGFETR
jgi:acylphosphatase